MSLPDVIPRSRITRNSRLLVFLVSHLLLLSTIAFGQTNSFYLREPQIDVWTSESGRLSLLIKNKAFLNVDATNEAKLLSKSLSRKDNEALLDFYRVPQGFLFSPPATKFSFAPIYEDMTPKYVFGAVGLIGTGLCLYAAMIGAQYDNHLINMIEGSVGFSMSLSAWVYFAGLPLWEPNAYDRDNVNRQLVEILVH